MGPRWGVFLPPLWWACAVATVAGVRCLLHEHKLGAETAAGSKVHVWMRLGPGRKAGHLERGGVYQGCYSSQRSPH